jgi:hypothetical protein
VLIFTTVTVTLQHCQWCTLLRFPQGSSKRSLLSIFHTVPPYSCKCIFIYVPRKNKTFPDMNRTKLTNAQQRYCKIHYTAIQPNWRINTQSTNRVLSTPISTVVSSLCRFPWHSQLLLTILWIFPLENFIQIDLKCIKSEQNFIYAPKWSMAFTASPLTKLVTECYSVETFYTEFYLNLSKNTKITGRISLRPGEITSVPELILTKLDFFRKLFLKNVCSKFHKNRETV